MLAQKKTQGLVRIMRALGYSWNGLKSAFHGEAAFRQELLLATLLIPLALYLGHNGIERVLLIGPILLVLIAELLNSAIEAVVDRFGGEQHELSERAKDMGSAAVLVALLLVVVTWGLVLLGNAD